MSNVIYLPERLKLVGGGELRLNTRERERRIRAWEMAKEYAKHKAATLYPDDERRKRAETRITHQHYRDLMFP